jgi:hypothetical protein
MMLYLASLCVMHVLSYTVSVFISHTSGHPTSAHFKRIKVFFKMRLRPLVGLACQVF